MNTNENTAKTNEPIWDSRNSDEPSTPLTNALETMRATARILSALTGQPATKPLHDLATDAVDLLNAERAAKEQLAFHNFAANTALNQEKQRAEQAEARLATVGDVLVNRYNEGRHLMNCGAETLACVRQIQDFLSSTTQPLLVAELERLRAEVKSAKSNAESWEACVRSQQTSKAPCGHWDGLCHTEDGGKTIHCYQCERDAAEKERDKLRVKLQVARHELDYLSCVCTCSRPTLPNPGGAVVAPGPHTARCVGIRAKKALAQLDGGKGKANG